MSVGNRPYSWQQGRTIAVVRTDSPLKFAVLNMKTRQPIVLMETAARIWELATQKLDFDEMLHCLELEYEMPKDEIEPFLSKFISGLESESFLERLNTKTDNPTDQSSNLTRQGGVGSKCEK